MGQPLTAKVAAILFLIALLGWLTFDALRPPEPFTSTTTGVASIKPHPLVGRADVPSATPLSETELVIAYTAGRCLGRIPDLPETLVVEYFEDHISLSIGPTPSSCDGDTDDIGFERSALIELLEEVNNRELIVTRTAPS